MSLSHLYQQTILEHAKHPRNAGRLEHPTHHGAGKNPLCGDALELMLHMEGNRITDVAFVGEGCAISQASCSLMTSEIKGKTVEEAEQLMKLLTIHLTAEPLEGLPGRLEILGGVRDYPSRVKCAMLAWRVLESILSEGGEVSTEDGN
ncbi:SUF system NifU family Fe-S cluster assembly protein [Candidatus Gracilibacteria bacterium CG17_big_fil_post_rev_8_21_14_2_50_48_13]|nr:MAG: SUF system NifU family Fe-S cluster assembly protein [Candidatus Gracilibacteria bacterium CG17_big_fil_post_rev_8_21_14_2_50_48_13]